MDMKKWIIRLAVLCPLAVAMTTVAWAQTTAVKANDFLNTIGVNTAICMGGDDPVSDATVVKQMGIREIRDDELDDNNGACTAALETFHTSTGAKVVLVASGLDTTSVSDDMNSSTALATAGALLAMEGPNEPYYYAPGYNNSPVIWQGQEMSNTSSPYWTPVADYQQYFYSQIKANSTLKSYPVWNISLGGWEPNDVGLQWLTIPSSPPDAATLTMPVGTVYADYANIHAYDYNGAFGINGATAPSESGCANTYYSTPYPNMMWNQDSTDATLETDDCVFGIYFNNGYTVSGFQGYTTSQLATLPKVMTETGIPESGEVGGQGFFSLAITDDQIGRYYLDLFLDGVKEGWAYTFLYELHDGDQSYGLVDANYNIRTQGTYLQNFTTILADTTSNFTPGSVNYSVPSEPVTVHDLLLQKSNETFYVAVWDEEQAGSGTTDTVTVDLGGNYNVSEFDPTVGISSIKTLTNVSSVSLTLSQSPILLQLSSASAPAAPVAAAATSTSSSGFTANWAASSGATAYYLDVSTSNGFTSFVSGYNNLSVGTLSSEPVNGLAASTTYYYRIRASNSAGTSGNSNTITVTTSAGAPAAPVAAAATSITTTGFTANWATSSGATGYYLDVSTSGGFSSFVTGYNNLSVGNVLTKAVTGLTAGTTYYYRVRASNSAGTSGNSNTITVTTSAAVPPAPVAAAATSITSTGFTANWAASSGATGYYLDVSTSSSFGTFVTGFNNLSVGNVLTTTVSGLTASTTYYYRIRANNSAGTSGNSNIITVTTLAAGSLPSPWTTVSIGATGTVGSASYSNGIFTVSSGNGGMDGASDNFRYVDEATSGNVTLIADVTSVSDPQDAWGDAGVMVRTSSAANAAYAGIFVSAGNGLVFSYRTATGAATTAVTGNNYGLYWVKLVRSGSTYSGYYSANGTTWTQLGSTVTITAIPTSATAGMAVSGDTAGDLCTATFSNVTSN